MSDVCYPLELTRPAGGVLGVELRVSRHLPPGLVLLCDRTGRVVGALRTTSREEVSRE